MKLGGGDHIVHFVLRICKESLQNIRHSYLGNFFIDINDKAIYKEVHVVNVVHMTEMNNSPTKQMIVCLFQVSFLYFFFCSN